MIHYRPTRELLPENGSVDAVSSHYHELVGRAEALMALVSRAKRAADESLSRANDAPQPHETSNTIFVALYEAHWRDREALFEAMRQLDVVREALQLVATR